VQCASHAAAPAFSSETGYEDIALCMGITVKQAENCIAQA